MWYCVVDLFCAMWLPGGRRAGESRHHCYDAAVVEGRTSLTIKPGVV
jgi:hypothetical protein